MVQGPVVFLPDREADIMRDRARFVKELCCRLGQETNRNKRAERLARSFEYGQETYLKVLPEDILSVAEAIHEAVHDLGEEHQNRIVNLVPDLKLRATLDAMLRGAMPVENEKA